MDDEHMAGRKRHSAGDIVGKLRRADELGAEGKAGGGKWDLDDPDGQPLETVRSVRDTIAEQFAHTRCRTARCHRYHLESWRDLSFRDITQQRP